MTTATAKKIEKLPVRLLLVEDDRHISEIVKFRVEKLGYPVACEYDGDAALKRVRENEFDIVLLDLNLPGRSGLEILKEIKRSTAISEVIILTANTAIEAATQALRHGALDYITKPIRFEDLEAALVNARERILRARRGLAVQRLVQARVVFPQIVTESAAMREVLETVEKVAGSDAPVLLLGESGTGKELVARTIHLKSARSQASFLPLNCASIPETLLESELFGHEKGSFTGAQEMRRGLFEVTHQGTLFLDEIGEMPPAVQPGFLRVLESGEFRRVGGTTTLHSDVRIVAATNRDMERHVREGKFRQDLFYRLNTVLLTLPPLRGRKEDIWPLALSFLAVIARDVGRPARFAEDIRPVFEAYPWPGNVRELRNLVERLVLLADGEVIGRKELPAVFTGGPVGEPAAPYGVNTGEILPLEEMERRHILGALERMKGNRRETAKVLKISEATLYRKLKEYGVTEKG